MEKQLNLTDEQLKIHLRKQISVNELEKLLHRNMKIFYNPKEADYSRLMARMEIDHLQQELRTRLMVEDMKKTIEWAKANTSKVTGSSAKQAKRAKKMTMSNRVKRFFHLN